MKCSSLSPWLFFGPLLLMLGGHLLWQITDSIWALRVALGALVWVAAVALFAFATHFRRYRKR